MFTFSLVNSKRSDIADKTESVSALLFLPTELVKFYGNWQGEEEALQTLEAGRQTKTLKVAFYKIAEVK